MQALSGKHQDIVRTLLAAEECDVTTRDTSGTSAQELASQMGVSLEVASGTPSSEDGTTTTKVGVTSEEEEQGEGKKTRRRVKELEHELEEQRNLVAGLRDMLNMVLLKDGTQTLVVHLQNELTRVREEGRMVAESSFRKLQGMRDEKIERMCLSSIEEPDIVDGSASGGSGGSGGGSAFDYLISILGLQDDDDDEEEL